MKKTIIFMVLILILLSPIYFLAVPPRVARVEAGFPNDLPGPKISPDSKLYFLKVWWEKIVLAFTFNPTKKAEEYKAFAEKRAAEAQEMIVKGKPAIAEKLKAVYQDYLNKAKDLLNKEIQKAIDKGKESLEQQLQNMVDDIMNKIKQGIKI